MQSREILSCHCNTSNLRIHCDWHRSILSTQYLPWISTSGQTEKLETQRTRLVSVPALAGTCFDRLYHSLAGLIPVSATLASLQDGQTFGASSLVGYVYVLQANRREASVRPTGISPENDILCQKLSLTPRNPAVRNLLTEMSRLLC
jgi:hypothetical protein